MWYTDKINAALIEEICTPVLTKLIAEEYRAGFEDGVLERCRNAIDAATDDEVDGDQARMFWSAGCCGDLDVHHRKSWARMGFTEEFMDLFQRAKEEERKEGCFVMPAWGTKGT